MRIRVLAVSDLHQSRELYLQLDSAVKIHRPTVVVIVGDLLHRGDHDGTMLSAPQAAAHLCHLPVQHLVMVRGNHEDENWNDFLDYWPDFGRPFHALYGSYVCFGPLMIVGFPCELGWEDPWRHTLPRTGSALPCVSWLLGRKRLVANPCKWLETLYNQHGAAAGSLWLMHEPPTDRTISTPAAGNRRWNRLVRTFRPQLTLSGHCHELPGLDSWNVNIGSSMCVNVGQGVQDLHYSVIDFDFDSSLGPKLPNRISVEAYPWKQTTTKEGGDTATAKKIIHPDSEHYEGAEDLSPDAIRARTRQAMLTEGGAISESELELHWATAGDEVKNLVASSSIISWKDDSGYQFPLWQFDRDGLILAGVAEVRRAVRHLDCWEAMRFFLEPTPSLDGARPLELLRQGQLAAVVRSAQRWKPEGVIDDKASERIHESPRPTGRASR